MLSHPNYGNSIINVISSIRRFYRCAYLYPTQKTLDEVLDKNYSNIVLMVISGMGTDILRRNTRNDDFLKTNKVTDITSVFPSGGVPALHSILSGVAPNEHGYLGSVLFFKEYGTSYDLYKGKTWRTEIPVNIGVDSLLAYEDIFAGLSIKNSGKNSGANKIDSFVLSDDILHTSATQILCKSFDDVCRKLTDITQAKADSFSLVYWSALQNIIRRTGTASDHLYNALSDISARIDMLSRNLNDTLIIITSDGGFIESDTVNLSDYPAIIDCLYMNPVIEPRAASFYVKSDRLELFERVFSDTFGSNFLLYPKSEAVRLFGAYRSHAKTDDFIGDFVAAATGKLTLRYGNEKRLRDYPVKAFSGGITEEEMNVPLILFGSKKSYDYEKLL